MMKFRRRMNIKNKREIMRSAWDYAGQLLGVNDEVIIEVREMKRTDEQNAMLHAMLSEIAQQKLFNNKKLTVEQWKMIFISGHKIATGGTAEIAIGLEGEIINLRESSAQMSVKRLASLIEYITVWASENDIRFLEYKNFNTTREAQCIHP